MHHFIFKNEINFSEDSKLETAMFGMGCFWGAEKKFWELEGVKLTAVGMLVVQPAIQVIEMYVLD